MATAPPHNSEKKIIETTVTHPIILIAFTIIAGIFTLILFAMLGWDGGLVEKLGTPNFARGLITYLFAITTIFTAVGLIVACLTTLGGHDDEEANKKFQRGKDVLGLLLGVFGTIVGFYFGTATQDAARAELAVTAPALDREQMTATETATLTAAVFGGLAPYRFAIGTAADGSFGDFQQVQPNGVIAAAVPATAFGAHGRHEIRLRVVDSTGAIDDTDVDVEITATAPAATNEAQ